MNFFRFIQTTELSQLGFHPQVRENVYTGNVNDPKFIDRVFLEKARFDPITASAFLDPRANLTDLISTSGMGFTMKFLMSAKLRSLFEKYRNGGVEFFRSPVIYRDKIHDNYWVMSVFKSDEGLLDFSRCNVLLRSRKEEGGTEFSQVDIRDYDDFKEKKKIFALESGFLFVENPVFVESSMNDIYILRIVSCGIGYFVSKKFKNTLLAHGVDGVDFQEIEV